METQGGNNEERCYKPNTNNMPKQTQTNLV